jgi:acyl-CoA thioester hydrolase
MAQASLTCRSVIYPWHCDHMGHMNVMWYVGKFDEATWHFLAAAGLTPRYLREARRGAVGVDQRTSYRRELYAGDIISIRSAAIEVRKSSLRFVHEMLNEETQELVAVTVLTGVHIDAVTRKSCPFPDDFRARAERLLAPDPAAWNQWPPAASFLS